jgi:hypothetical protein
MNNLHDHLIVSAMKDATVELVASSEYGVITPKNIADPKTKVYMMISVNVRFITDDVVDYKKGYDSLWIGAMQKWVAEPYLMIDPDGDDEIYVIYFFQNDRKNPAMLGRLKKESFIWSEAKKAFTSGRF